MLRAISSMATKQILAELTAAFEAQSGLRLAVESVGGVDAARRVRAGEAFDVVLLASDAIEGLIASGHLLPDSRCDWVHSPVAVAVPAGAPCPDIHSESQLKAAVLAAASLSYSTGPSGVYLEKLFARWGIAEQIQSRIVVPPPGTPVGAWVASGRAELGFQQYSEFISVPGIQVLGTLPPEVAYITTFSAGLTLSLRDDATRLAQAKSFLNFLCAPETEPIKQRQGMSWLS